MNVRPVLLSAVMTLSIPALLGAGTVINVKDSARFNTTSKLYLSKGNLRIEAVEEKRVMIYRAADDSFLRLDPATRIYQDLGAAVNAAAPAGAPAPASAVYRKVGPGEAVNGVATVEYEVTQGGEKIADVLMADPKAAGVDPADVAGFRLLAKRMQASRTPPRGYALSASAPDGVPMRTTSYYKGLTFSINELTVVGSQEIPAAMFELPADYKKASADAP